MKTMACAVLVALVVLISGCGGSNEPTATPIHPPTLDVRVETPISYDAPGYDQGAYLVGTQTWRIYSQELAVPVPVEQGAIELHGPFYKEGYVEWSLTALSSWRTDLNVMVGNRVVKKMFVVTERVDRSRLVIEVEGAERVGDSTMFRTDMIVVGESLDITVSWSCGEGWPQFQEVPVIWEEFPDGVNVEVSDNGKRLHIEANSPVSAEFIGNIANVYFRVMVPISLH